MQRILFLSVVLCLNLTLARGQSERLKYLGIEAGSDFYEVEYHNLDFMRKSKSSQAVESVPGHFQKIYTGIKTEFRTTSNRVGFFSGIRFTKIYNTIGKSSPLNESSKAFYIQHAEDETSIELLRVKDLSQTAFYIGVPVEARYFLFTPKKIGLYVKSSVEFNYLVQTNTEVVFYQDDMIKYEASIKEKIKDPDKFYSAMFFGFGIKLGANDKPNLNVEACLPTFFLTEYSTGFVEPQYGGGIQVNIQVPF